MTQPDTINPEQLLQLLRAERENVQRSTAAAIESWHKAPAHHRALAGALVEPLLRALIAQSNELAALSRFVQGPK